MIREEVIQEYATRITDSLERIADSLERIAESIDPGNIETVAELKSTANDLPFEIIKCDDNKVALRYTV
jgi:hypothetical protein